MFSPNSPGFGGDRSDRLGRAGFLGLWAELEGRAFTSDLGSGDIIFVDRPFLCRTERARNDLKGLKVRLVHSPNRYNTNTANITQRIQQRTFLPICRTLRFGFCAHQPRVKTVTAMMMMMMIVETPTPWTGGCRTSHGVKYHMGKQ